MTRAFEQIMAEHRAEQQRQLAAARQRIILFALESIAGDGLPRVSAYTVEHLVGEGLIESAGDRFRLTAEGRIALQANPTETPASDELALFGALS
ncbi:hypothetical protein [Mycolicibacterium fortuitum]|uniref:hypothetical protein n=1 Tax=Mycolicibacterium fortuitum TaxID=1766 RepID=UPI0026273E1D|nr:hypothetical protein [Mycolicibacterium fortuitum]